MTSPPAHAPTARTEIDLRARRLRQLLWMLMAALMLLALVNLATGAWHTAAQEALPAALLGLAYQSNRRGHTFSAAWLTLIILTLTLIGLTASNHGLYDEAPMALPGVLIFASMFSSRRMLIGLAALMIASLVLVYLMHLNGAFLEGPRADTLQQLIALVLILLVTAVFVSFTSADLNRLVARLQAKKIALQQSNERIAELAFHDPLTGLPNRAQAQEHLRFLLAQAQRERRIVAVLFLDLDHFKTINDSLGHSVGDELLRQVAARLQKSLRNSDMAARLSGDEFLLLLGGAQDLQAVTAATARVLQQFVPPFTLQGMPVHATCSVGVSVYPRDGETAQTLLKNADLAMYQSKAAGRNTFRFFDDSMNAHMLEHLHLAAGLREALAQGELRLHYQPQVDLRTGRVIGAEALLRWPHPELGPIPPDKFIPVAESSGLIHELGLWVLHQACRDAQAFRAQGLADLTIAVNVSPLQFRRGHLDQEVAAALAQAGLPAHAIELEITESLLVDDNERLHQTLASLHRMGVRIAIDDFGTGYSNLGYLQRYAVHRLKIDQSFTRRLCASGQIEGIVQAIIQMAHCLHLQVVAEGVEDAGTLARLRAGGCEYGQGFHWSPALAAGQFAAYARQA